MDDKQVVEKVKSEFTWLQKHERMIVVFLVLLVAGFLGNKYLNNRIANAEARVTVAEQRLADQKVINDKLAEQSAAQAAQYSSLVDMLTRQNAALAAAITTRDAALKQKQEEIKNMPLPKVATEWEALLKLPQGVLSVLSTAPTSISVPDAAARQTVTELEKVPVLEANLADQMKISANKQAELDSANAVISAKDAQIKGLSAQLVAQDTACKAEVSKIKAIGRKSKIKWFLTGFVSGLLARSAIQGL